MSKWEERQELMQKKANAVSQLMICKQLCPIHNSRHLCLLVWLVTKKRSNDTKMWLMRRQTLRKTCLFASAFPWVIFQIFPQSYKQMKNNGKKNLRNINSENSKTPVIQLEYTCSLLIIANKTNTRPEYFWNLFSKYTQLFFVFQKSYAIWSGPVHKPLRINEED